MKSTRVRETNVTASATLCRWLTCTRVAKVKESARSAKKGVWGGKKTQHTASYITRVYNSGL